MISHTNRRQETIFIILLEYKLDNIKLLDFL